jgi:hypothetical protein
VSSLVYIVLQINGKVIRVNGEAGPGIVEMATREKASYIVIGSNNVNISLLIKKKILHYNMP